MKITINIDDNTKDTEIAINCKQLTPDIERIIATLRILNQQITAEKDGETHLLDVSKIIYIESIDRKTFIYTQGAVYESKLKLYEIEENLSESGFFRASKSSIVQLRYIRSIKTDINRRIRLTLENDEQLIVSRQYADELKKRLGVL